MSNISTKHRRKQKAKIHGFRVLEKECIWMKAGVISFRECDNNYDCNTCAFDKAMARTMAKAVDDNDRHKPGWVTYLKTSYDGRARPCRHVLTGRIEGPKICPFDYECHHCAFDQMLDDSDLVNALDAPSYCLAAGYKMADGYYYHIGHNWVRFEHGGNVRIGFDDFISRLFGVLDTMELPPLGATLQQGQVGVTIRRNSNHAAVLSPMSGTVLAVNYNACSHPQIINADSYHQGWLMILEPSSPKKGLKKLYFGKESMAWIEQENERLLAMLGPKFEKMAATGARPIADIYGSIPELRWDRLVHEFLHTEEKR